MNKFLNLTLAATLAFPLVFASCSDSDNEERPIVEDYLPTKFTVLDNEGKEVFTTEYKYDGTLVAEEIFTEKEDDETPHITIVKYEYSKAGKLLKRMPDNAIETVYDYDEAAKTVSDPNKSGKEKYVFTIDNLYFPKSAYNDVTKETIKYSFDDNFNWTGLVVMNEENVEVENVKLEFSNNYYYSPFVLVNRPAWFVLDEYDSKELPTIGMKMPTKRSHYDENGKLNYSIEYVVKESKTNYPTLIECSEKDYDVNGKMSNEDKFSYKIDYKVFE